MADPYAAFKDADPYAGFNDAPPAAKPVSRPRGAGTQASPFDLSGGYEGVAIPKETFYRDSRGNIRRNENGLMRPDGRPQGNPIIQPAPAARKPAQRGQSRSPIDEANGLLGNFYRGTVVLDEANAGVMALGNAVFGGGVPIQRKPGESPYSPMPLVRSVTGTYQNALARQRGAEDDFVARRPLAAGMARNVGTTASVFVPGGAPSQVVASGGRIAGAARGATVAAGQGYAYGLADRGTGQERLQTAQDSALLSGAFGLGLGAATSRGAPRAAPTRPAPPSNNEILKGYGVQQSIPQQIGGLAKTTEDIAMRFPIIGSAISGARGRTNVQLNRGVALEAMDAIGQPLPKDIRPGFDTVQFVDDALGKVYDDAVVMVPRVMPDEQLALDIAEIGLRKSDLAETTAKQFDSIIANRLARLQGGEVSGQTVKKIQGELRDLAAEQAAKGEESLAGMLNDSAEAVMGVVARANPESAAMIRSADKGWRIYSILNDAAAAASLKGGVWTPSQLSTQVKRAGKRMGSNMTGKGRAPLQDLVTAAGAKLPDQFGNPGTANALALLGGGYGVAAAPVETAVAGGVLAAASTPYYFSARKIVETLPVNAGRAELMAAERQLADLARRDPAAIALLQSVQAKLARASGVLGANANQQ